MAIFSVNASTDGALRCHDSDLPRGSRALAGRVPAGGSRCEPWAEALDRALEALPPAAPVTVLIHGFRYTWRRDIAPAACPHDMLFRPGRVIDAGRGARPCRAAWAGDLGYSAADPADGLCIGFAWEARLGRYGGSGFQEIYRRAKTAGRTLARLLARISERRPDLAPGMLSHSLGARVALSASAEASEVPLGPMVLLGAAEYAGRARAALAASPARREVLHVMSRSNDAYDAVFSMLAPRGEGRDRTLGVAGLGLDCERWLDIQLDHPRIAAWMAERGIRLDRLGERVSHWQTYADRGAMAFYRRVLRREPGYSIAGLRAAAIPEAFEPRWARLAALAPRLAAASRTAEPETVGLSRG